MTRLHLTIAQDYAGNMVDIADVPSGLACGCICASCGESLVARKGEVKQWHFAHKSGSECAGAIETALHRAAKQILLQHPQIMVPGDVFARPRSSIWLNRFNLYPEEVYKIDELVAKVRPDLFAEFSAAMELNTSAIQLALVNVEDEVRDALTRRIPDIRCGVESAHFMEHYPKLPGNAFQEGLFIEIAVFHKCDETKIADLQSIGRPALEVDLRDMVKEGTITLESLRRFLAETNAHRYWLVMPEYLARAHHVRDNYIDESVILYKEEMEQRLRLSMEEERRQRVEAETAFWAAMVAAKRSGSSAVRFRLNTSATGIILPYDVGYAIALDYVQDISLFDRIQRLFQTIGWKKERFGKKVVFLSYQSLDQLLNFFQNYCQMNGYDLELLKRTSTINRNDEPIPIEEIAIFDPRAYEPGSDFEEG